MAAPLEGVRVIDLGHHVAGPLAAMMLADHGADVIRIERPVDPAALPPTDAFYNRGKRRISLDLTAPQDREVARRLIVGADVLVENFRPGVLSRHGLGFEDLELEAPGLVHLSMPGFAPDDPRSGLPAWEAVVDAATGNTRIRAGEAPAGWDTGRPTYSAVPIASDFAAFLGVVGTVAALIERCRSGRGQHVSVPLFDAMFEAMGDAASFVTERGRRPQVPLHANGSGIYACRDGYVQFNPIGASRRFVTWFLTAAGRPEWARDRDDDLLRSRLTELFLTRDADEWEELGRVAGVPLARTRTSRQWLHTTHAQDSGAVVRLDDPVLGPTLMPGTSVDREVPPEQTPGPRPRRLPDADRETLLRESAAPCDPIAATASPETRSAPLAGLRVLDLTQILAGPSCGRILGELGAAVTKINAPQRGIAAHGVVNRGKESILLDVERETGQAVFWKLLDETDVVVQNFPPGTAERYGIGSASVLAQRPETVHVSVSCYGASGPWRQGRGYETQAQACTGITARAGGYGSPPAVLGPYNLLDYGTGVMAAFAAVLGIYQRIRTGSAAPLRASLVQTASYHQARFMLDYERAREGTEPHGPAALGEHPLHRFYRGADGWFALGAAPADLPRLAAVAGLSELAGRDAAAAPLWELVGTLERLFRHRTAGEWVADLVAAGIGAHEIVGLDDLLVDPVVRRRGVTVTQHTDEVGEVLVPGPPITLSATPLEAATPARPPGTDAARILERVGLGGSLDELERTWSVQTAALPAGWPA